MVSAIKVLAYVHTYNSADVIDATITALCGQTYPVSEVLLVDNASSDGTPDRAFPDKVTLIRHRQNLGTSGAVAVGMRYALAHGYDWIYIVDADSIAEPDAIEKLVKSYLSLPPDVQASTWRLHSLPKDANNGFLHHGSIFTPRGVRMLSPPCLPSRYPCDAQIWSGSLYRLRTVSKVGLPDPNYVIDWDDMIYGYEGMVRGYIGFVDQSSIVNHQMGALETLRSPFGIRFIKIFDMSAMRSYYRWRNSLYFWIYTYRREHSVMPVIIHFMRFSWWLIRVALFVRAPVPILSACLRGVRDGSVGNS